MRRNDLRNSMGRAQDAQTRLGPASAGAGPDADHECPLLAAIARELARIHDGPPQRHIDSASQLLADAFRNLEQQRQSATTPSAVHAA